MNMQEMIDNLIEQLKTERETLASAKTEANAALDAFKSSDDVYVYQSEIAEKSGRHIAELESAIRAAALEEFNQTGNKKPHDNVQVKIFKAFRVADPARVLAWVKTNLADALVYDEKKVKSYAEKIGAVEGTEITEEARAQIDTKL